MQLTGLIFMTIGSTTEALGLAANNQTRLGDT